MSVLEQIKSQQVVSVEHMMEQEKKIIQINDVSISYGDFVAVKNVSIDVAKHKVTAFIGPSGCGKSTVLRAINRMNDTIPGSTIKGEIVFENHYIYDDRIDPVLIRREIGMVFQKPNPFPKSIYENIAWGARINGFKGDYDELVEKKFDTSCPMG